MPNTWEKNTILYLDILHDLLYNLSICVATIFDVAFWRCFHLRSVTAPYKTSTHEGADSEADVSVGGTDGETPGGRGRKRRYPTSRPFKCDQCNDAFNQRIHLKKHLSKHTGTSPSIAVPPALHYSKKISLKIPNREFSQAMITIQPGYDNANMLFWKIMLFWYFFIPIPARSKIKKNCKLMINWKLPRSWCRTRTSLRN